MLHAIIIVIFMHLFSSFVYGIKPLARFIVDNPTYIIGVEMSGSNDEIGHIKREETLAIETSGITLWQHECLAGIALGINVAEIRTGVESVIATGTEYQPARVSAPIME